MKWLAVPVLVIALFATQAAGRQPADPNRLVHCSGSANGGFFTRLTERHTTCVKARRVMRRWVKNSGFAGKSGAKKTTTVGIYVCRLVVIQTNANSDGRVTCRSKSGKYVRFYGRP
jgi:hypothetical protein